MYRKIIMTMTVVVFVICLQTSPVFAAPAFQDVVLSGSST